MPPTDYEVLEESSTEGKRLLRQEDLLIDAQEEIAIAMSRECVVKADLAERLGKSRSFVTQVLNSGRNLTLRTWADIATALGYRVVPKMIKDGPRVARSATSTAEFKIMGDRVSDQTLVPFEPQKEPSR